MAKITLNRVNEFITRHRIRCNKLIRFRTKFFHGSASAFPLCIFYSCLFKNSTNHEEKVYLD